MAATAALTCVKSGFDSGVFFKISMQENQKTISVELNFTMSCLLEIFKQNKIYQAKKNN